MFAVVHRDSSAAKQTAFEPYLNNDSKVSRKKGGERERVRVKD